MSDEQKQAIAQMKESPGWQILDRHFTERLDQLTRWLVNQDNEETRGRIKEIESFFRLLK